ncbi:MAG TPA: hypothetical protein PKZ32_09865, partial [Candidatus Melainabacteria bacterium]|nr:hypothetical protein [Candidatus Melainabacteria bacterium]
MNTALTRRVLAGLALLTIVSPMAAYADHDHDRHHNKNWRGNWNRNHKFQQKYYKNVQKAQRKQYNNYRKLANNVNRDYW